MRFQSHADSRLPSSSQAAATAIGKRNAPRHVQHTLRSNLGDVLDLSPQGIRIKCRRVPTGRTEIILRDFTTPGQLYGEVVWSKPSGNFHHEVGFRFEKMPRAMAERLQTIAMNHRFRRAI